MYFSLPFISFARPKETKQRKRRLFQGIFWPKKPKTVRKIPRSIDKKSINLNLGILPTYSGKKGFKELKKFYFLFKTLKMKKLKNIHPGEVLKEEFLDPMEISAYRLSKETFIPQTRISEIIRKKRRITADTALRLSRFFGTTAKFWLGLQDDYDLEEEKSAKEKEINNIKPLENRSA